MKLPFGYRQLQAYSLISHEMRTLVIPRIEEAVGRMSEKELEDLIQNPKSQEILVTKVLQQLIEESKERRS
jgi:hypothetical protein